MAKTQFDPSSLGNGRFSRREECEKTCNSYLVKLAETVSGGNLAVLDEVFADPSISGQGASARYSD
jgi:hypothetical protein